MSAGATRSTLRFSDDRERALTQQAVTVFAGYARPSRVSFRLAAGVVLDGSLRGAGRTYELGRGELIAASVTRQIVRGAWFFTGTFALGASRTTTVEDRPGAAPVSVIATDASLGATAGRTFARRVSPYLLTRGFGGPVFWRVDGDDLVGSDVHHFQLGAGVSVTTASGLAVVVDVSVLGEQSASVGVALRR